MRRATLIPWHPFVLRLGGIAAILGGAACVGLVSPGNFTAGALYRLGLLGGNSSAADNIVLVALLLGGVAAVIALHILQSGRYGTVGALSALVSVAGLLMLAGGLAIGYGAEGPAGDPLLQVSSLLFWSGLLLSSVGLIAGGISTIRAGVLPWWCGAALLAGSPPAGIGLSTFMWIVGDAALMPVGIAWMVVGVGVLRVARRRPSRRTASS